MLWYLTTTSSMEGMESRTVSPSSIIRIAKTSYSRFMPDFQEVLCKYIKSVENPSECIADFLVSKPWVLVMKALCQEIQFFCESLCLSFYWILALYASSHFQTSVFFRLQTQVLWSEAVVEPNAPSWHKLHQPPRWLPDVMVIHGVSCCSKSNLFRAYEFPLFQWLQLRSLRKCDLCSPPTLILTAKWQESVLCVIQFLMCHRWLSCKRQGIVGNEQL